MKAELDFSKDYICPKLSTDRELQQVKSLILCKMLQLPLCKERNSLENILKYYRDEDLRFAVKYLYSKL